MKVLVIILCFLCLSCSGKKLSCPSERAYFLALDGQVFVMEKGFFDTKDGRWLTEEEFKQLVEKYKRNKGY